MRLVNLKNAEDASVFGGKAANLAKGINSGLPVPDGFAMDTIFVEEILKKNTAALNMLKIAFLNMNTSVAVRSSAIGEDSKNASFAGQYLSVLNIKTLSQLIDAIFKISESSKSDSVQDYQMRVGLSEVSKMAIVVQKLINVDVAGVMFTRNPLTKNREILIESAWGMGEVVVSGLVIPDSYKLDMSNGSLLESKSGIKDLLLAVKGDGGTEEITLDFLKAKEATLKNDDLENLYQLANICEFTYGNDLDIEWGLLDKNVYLLQCRAITA